MTIETNGFRINKIKYNQRTMRETQQRYFRGKKPNQPFFY
jgi:hypothetical protein